MSKRQDIVIVSDHLSDWTPISWPTLFMRSDSQNVRNHVDQGLVMLLFD